MKSHRRSAIICGLTLLLPVFVYLNLMLGAWGARAEYVSEINRLEPRIARLQGIKAHEAQLTRSAEGARQTLNRLVHDASTNRTEVSAALQNDVRQLFTDAGLSVTNSQVLPLREGEQFDYVGLKLTVTGDMTSLDEALASLVDFSPVIVVETLDVWPNRTRSSRNSQPAQQTITASLKLVSLRAVI